MLSKRFRLPSKQFQNTFNSGKKIKGSFGMAIINESDSLIPRFGFVVSKKVGNSVIRHKHTRRLREISKELIQKYSLKNLDLQYVSFEYVPSYLDLKNDFEEIIRKYIKER